MQKLQLSMISDSYTQHQKLDMWRDIHYHGKCPICSSTGSMLLGPRGALSINIKCKICYMVFSTTPFSGFGAYPIGYDIPTQNVLQAKARLFTEELSLLEYNNGE